MSQQLKRRTYDKFWQGQPLPSEARVEEEPAIPVPPKPHRRLRTTPDDLCRMRRGERTLLWTRADAAERKRKRRDSRDRGEPDDVDADADKENRADPAVHLLFQHRYPDPTPDPSWPADPMLDRAYLLYSRRRRETERKALYRARKRARPENPSISDLSFSGRKI